MLQQINELNERIEQLESRLAFQDDTIEILNQALTLQQQDLDNYLEQLAEAGADYIITYFPRVAYDHTMLERFAAEVMPGF